MAVLCFVPSAMAQGRDGSPPTALRIQAASPVNIRSGPGWQYPLVGQVIPSVIPNDGGQIYLSTGASGAWRRIWWNGGEGWVQSVYAKPVSGIYAARVMVPVAPVMVSAYPGLSTVGQVYRDQEYSIVTGWFWGTTKIRWGGQKVKVSNAAVEWVLR